MLKIRLQRTGRNHETTFRIVLTDSQNSPKSGRYLEMLGNYDPRKSNEQINTERITHWISKGAKLSDTLHNLFVEKKIITGKKVNALPKRTPIKKDTPPEAPQASAPQAAPEVKPEPAPVA
ncbi:MAG: hypothetical protein RJA61_200 [Candidatus Parcubacteria bacterium]|jgi:small subunit ribosomal protein S16